MKIRNILYLFSFLLLSVHLYAQPSLIIEHKDGSKETLDFYQIENIVFDEIDESQLMLVYMDDSMPFVFRAMDIDTLHIETYNGEPSGLKVSMNKVSDIIDLSKVDSIKFETNVAEIDKNVIPLDTINPKSLIEYDQGLMVFDKSKARHELIQVDKIIVSGPVARAANGFLRRVTEVTESNDTLYVETKAAGIYDAVKNGFANLNRKILSADIAETNTAEKVKQEKLQADGFTFTVDDFVLYEKGPASIKLNGSFTVDPDIIFNLYIKDYELQSFRMEFSLEEKLDLQLKGNVEAGFESSKTLVTWKINPYTIMVGYVPIVITSKIDLIIGADGELNIELVTGVDQSAVAKCGLLYNNKQWKQIKHFQNNFEYNPPELAEANARARAYLGPRFSISLYNLNDYFDGFVHAFGFLELNLDLLKEPCIRLDAGIEANAGVTAPFLGEDCNYSFEEPFEFRRNIYDYHCELSIDSISPNPICPGSAVTLYGTGFGYKQNKSTIDFGGETPETILSWNDEEVSFIAPTNAPMGDVSLTVHGQQSNVIKYHDGGCRFDMTKVTELKDGIPASGFPVHVSSNGQSVVYFESRDYDISGDVNDTYFKIYYFKIGEKPRLVWQYDDYFIYGRIKLRDISYDNSAVMLNTHKYGEIVVNTKTGKFQKIGEFCPPFECKNDWHWFVPGDTILSPNGRKLIVQYHAPWGYDEETCLPTINPDGECGYWETNTQFEIDRMDKPFFTDNVGNDQKLISISPDGSTVFFYDRATKQLVSSNGKKTTIDEKVATYNTMMCSPYGKYITKGYPVLNKFRYYDNSGELHFPDYLHERYTINNCFTVTDDGYFLVSAKDNEEPNGGAMPSRYDAITDEFIQLFPLDFYDVFFEVTEASMSADGQTVASFISVRDENALKGWRRELFIIKGISYKE